MKLVYIVQYACTGAIGKRQANHMHFVLLLQCKEGTRNKGYDTNYLYKLLTVFRVVPQVVCGFLPIVGKTVNTTGITLHANLYHFLL
jgi:hypothetical protein